MASHQGGANAKHLLVVSNNHRQVQGGRILEDDASVHGFFCISSLRRWQSSIVLQAKPG
jgi:hypothetical protein